MCTKWDQAMLEYLTLSNGARQGGILSPCVFTVYVDDLSKQLISALGLQKLLDVCYNSTLKSSPAYHLVTPAGACPGGGGKGPGPPPLEIKKQKKNKK